jgi:hypothetical protein
MSYASYERQHLALYAAGFLRGEDGGTRVSFGCELTRIATGIYGIIFGNDAGLIEEESYTQVTVKSRVGASGAPKVILSVEDTSNTVKTIFASGITVASAALTMLPVNTDLEIAVYRTVTRT